MVNALNIPIIEPYYGGSHAEFVDLFIRHTRHHCVLITMPARKWKWRMRGAAMWAAMEETHNLSGDVDVFFVSDMLSVCDLRALLPDRLRNTPVVCYFHENQLTYPVSPHDSPDYQFAMTNITSCLAATQVWFNSRFHMEDFLQASAKLLRKMPDFVPSGVISQIRSRSFVHPPAVSIETSHRVDNPPAADSAAIRHTTKATRILWCHRWEFDKNPAPFFDTLIRLDRAGFDFELVFVGEQFRTAPTVFADSWASLKRHIVHAGFIKSRTDYLNMLASCDVVVSTAIQENFGIAVIEAILCGCQPLLPDRLAYPEVIPESFHAQCLYSADEVLFERLCDVITGPGKLPPGELSELRSVLASRYDPTTIASAMDDAFEALVSSQC